MGNPSLEGIRVLDLTHEWSGPHCTRILADFGAEVIRVECLQRLCMFRGARTDNRHYNHQPPWHQMNRNKYSITLDLKDEYGRGVFADLVRNSDVLVENGRTGVMERLGFSYENVAKINAEIIMVSMAAFGNTGPHASYPAYGAALEVMSGIQNLTAYGKGEKPQRFKEMDVINGIGGACAILTALLYRQKTGEGQHVDLSQMEFPTHVLGGEHFLEYTMNGSHMPPQGNRHRRYAPQGCYRCRGDDKWVTLTIRSDVEWERFCQALGHPEWQSDSRFNTVTARMAHHDKLDGLIEEWTADRNHCDVMQVLQGHAIPSGAVLDTPDLSSNEHLGERGYFIEGVAGSDKAFPGMPFRLSEGAGSISRPGPDLGQHNEFVLCELLGRSKDEVKPIDEDDIRTAYESE